MLLKDEVIDKMNILYSAFLREDSESKGVLKKVNSQCLAFKKDFDNVYLYVSRQFRGGAIQRLKIRL